MSIFGIDPGYRFVGYAHLPFEGEVQACGVIATKKAKGATTSDDEVDTARIIYRELAGLLGVHRPKIICAETLSTPRNSSTARKMGVGWGAIMGATESLELGVMHVHPKTIRRLLDVPQSAPKSAVHEIVLTSYPEVRQILETARLARGKWEHALDAVAAAMACMETTEGRFIKKLAGK